MTKPSYNLILVLFLAAKSGRSRAMDLSKKIGDPAASFDVCRKTLSAMGDETRQHIIPKMTRMDYRGMRVPDITERTGLSRPAVSHHLQILKEAGVVKMRMEGIAPSIPEEAVGLLLWDGRFMTPLVPVRESGTLVWETGCGSGSTALGAYPALKRGEGVTNTQIAQPGGIVTAGTEVRGGRVTRAFITGRVRIIGEDELFLPERG